VRVAKSENGKPVIASKNGPNQAICPVCSGKVVLRKRKQMGGSVITYYWRHFDGKNPNCPERWQLR
jgi:hypothetical protein